MTERGHARVDGRSTDTLPVDDRGLAYGDGLFETILVAAGRPVFWSEHLERLATGAARLGLSMPAEADWRADLDALLADDPAATTGRRVLKLLLTRGSGARGYAFEAGAPVRRIARLLPAPPPPARPLVLRWCRLRLAPQPALAGLKHLNRLEQVLARGEWQNPAIDEGLLCTTDGSVVSAIAANLVVGRGGELLTPPVETAGVAGVCRGRLLALGPVREQRLLPDEVEQADELFLCNSVRGILPVGRLGERAWPVGPLTRAAAARLAAIEPAYSSRVVDVERP